MKARVRRYIADRKYGFLVPLEEGIVEDVFFHLSVFDPRGGPPPISNEMVTYDRPSDGTKATSVVRDIVPAHETGKIRSYDPVKGYGFITSEAGQRYLHKSEVIGGLIPAVGALVHYYITDNGTEGKSARACYVSILT